MSKELPPKTAIYMKLITEHWQENNTLPDPVEWRNGISDTTDHNLSYKRSKKLKQAR